MIEPEFNISPKDKEIDVIAPVRLLNVTSARALNPMLLGLSLNNSTLLTIGESKRFCIRSSSGESPLTIEKVTILLAGESTESTFKTRLQYLFYWRYFQIFT